MVELHGDHCRDFNNLEDICVKIGDLFLSIAGVMLICLILFVVNTIPLASGNDVLWIPAVMLDLFALGAFFKAFDK